MQHRDVVIRRFREGDEAAVSHVICTTLDVSNRRDYAPAFIEEHIRKHTPERVAASARDAHVYVACDGDAIIGCGAISGYWGSTEESYLSSIFVLPDHQRRGVGRRIVEALEADAYFRRAWRTEVGASLTAVPFYLRVGYVFKDGRTDADTFGVVRMEKRRERDDEQEP